MARPMMQTPPSPLDREGFLCPICVTDLGDSNSLARHFESAHGDGDKDGDVLDQVKGFFGKAKKFFALDQDLFENDEGDDTPRQRSSSARQSTGPIYYEPQELGKTRNLTDYFKSVRDAKVDRAVIEGNKIVIRLSKLVADDAPDEGAKRRAFEQKIVPWADDKACKTCSTCGKGFNITRRRHHCRLCGGIMCDKCSEFLPNTQAKLFCSAASSTEVMVTQPSFLRRRGSNSSLNSVGTQETGPTLRMCSNCRKLLELHKSKQEQRHYKPTVVELYERLLNSKQISEGIAPEYSKMAFSILSGETTHSLEKASALRQEIGKLYNEMESISKRIMNLKPEDDSEISEKTLKLQLNIRAFTISYIQECSATLPNLPNQEQLTQLIHQKEEERKKRLQRELEEAQMRAKATAPMRRQPQVTSLSSNQPSRQSRETVSVGWKPGEVDTRQVQDDDPMVQQMNIIRGYLKQAKQAQRWDEVDMLQDNLKHLEDEFYRQSSPNNT